MTAHKLKRRLGLNSLITSVICGMALLTTSTASAVVIVSDTFDANISDDVADSLDLAYYTNNGSANLLWLSNDAVLGSCLRFRPYSSDTRSVTGALGAGVNLNTVGSSLAWSFDFALKAISLTSPSVSFGLYNTNGTAAMANGSTASNNDYGYLVTMPLTGNAQLLLGKESGTNSTVLQGTDVTTLGTSTETLSLTTGVKYTSQLTIVRSGVTNLTISIIISQGSNVLATTSYVDSVTSDFSIDEIVIGASGTGTSPAPRTDLVVDNIKLESTSVPEAASLGLLGAIALPLLVSAKRR